jgi:hypothetical protein
MQRPSFFKVKESIGKIGGISGGNLIDHLIRRMEKYATDLEEQVNIVFVFWILVCQRMKIKDFSNLVLYGKGGEKDGGVHGRERTQSTIAQSDATQVIFQN